MRSLNRICCWWHVITNLVQPLYRPVPIKKEPDVINSDFWWFKASSIRISQRRIIWSCTNYSVLWLPTLLQTPIRALYTTAPGFTRASFISWRMLKAFSIFPEWPATSINELKKIYTHKIIPILSPVSFSLHQNNYSRSTSSVSSFKSSAKKS